MEEYAAKFTLGTGTPWRELSRSRISATRVIRSRMERRDPHRNVTAARPIFSSYGIAWDFPFSADSGNLALIAAHLCDPGTAVIGSKPGLLPATAHARLADGSEWKFNQGILRDFQIIAEPRQPVQLSSAWEFGSIEESAYPDTLPPPGGRNAGPQDITIALGTTPCVTFAGTVAFTREARPAGYALDGSTSAFKGRAAVDIVGRMTVRLENGFPALAGQFADSITITVAVGTAQLLVTIPQAVFQTTSRRIVSSNLTDYSLEWLATKAPASPLASFVFA